MSKRIGAPGRRAQQTISLAIAAALFLSACGSSGGSTPSSTSTDSTTEATTENAAGGDEATPADEMADDSATDDSAADDSATDDSTTDDSATDSTDESASDEMADDPSAADDTAPDDATDDSGDDASAATASDSTANATGTVAKCTADQVSLVYSGRDLANPYYVAADQGAQFFADSVGRPYKFVESNSDSAQQLSQVQSILAADGPCVALNIDPNETSIVPQILKAVEEAEACMVTQWSKPEDISPLDSNNWAAHVTYDGVAEGELIANKLFEAMGGKGNIVALQGILDNEAAQTRFTGLQNALKNHPDIKLLDDQSAGWSIDEAQSVTEAWLAQYGDDINGVWAANDGMGIGAVEALRAEGKEGTVPVVGIDATPEGLDAVKNGEFVVTVSPDAPYQGGIGLDICYQVLTGELDLSTVPAEKRVAYHDDVVIDKDNVDQYLNEPTADQYAEVWKDPFGRANKPAK